MKETLNEYKKTIEENSIYFTYLYDGDVISSTSKSFSQIKEHRTTSPSLIIDCVSEIYNISFIRMIERSQTIDISHDMIKLNSDKILKIIDNLNIDTQYLFCSKYTKGFFISTLINNRRPFPGYFYNTLTFPQKNYDLYYSPLIEDIENQASFFAIDSSIQSLVYSIQNMVYDIKETSDGILHTITYPFYECDYNSYKINIKDISKLRDEKINKILGI